MLLNMAPIGRRTCLALLQPVAVGQHERRVGGHLADEHGEGAAGDVRFVEPDAHVVHAVLLRDEAQRQQVHVELLHEAVVDGARRNVDERVDPAAGPVQVDVERHWLADLRIGRVALEGVCFTVRQGLYSPTGSIARQALYP